MSKNVKHKVISSMLYKNLELVFLFGVRFTITIVLARLLSPAEFGVVALTNIFIDISMVLIDNGLGNSLIQKKDADEKDFASVFMMILIVAVILYVIIYITAPAIAAFYDEPLLKDILRVLSLSLILSTYQVTINAKQKKELNFKMISLTSTVTSVASGIIGIGMAYLGFGVWALVGQRLSKTVLYIIMLSIATKWHPEIYLSLNRIKPLWKFSWKIFAQRVMNKIMNNIRALLIGTVYSTEMLAFYNKGKSIPYNFISITDGSIQSVMFPTLSMYQNDLNKLKAIARRSLKMSTYIVAPIMIGFVAIADPFVEVLLTDKWLPSVVYIRIFCLSYILRPTIVMNNQVLNARGRSDTVLKVSIIKNVLNILAILITIKLGVLYIALTVPLTSLIHYIILSNSSGKGIKYPILQQIQDVLPNVIIAFVMGVVVYLITFLDYSTVVILIMQVVVGILLYIVLSTIFKISSFEYIINIIKERYNSKQIKKGEN